MNKLFLMILIMALPISSTIAGVPDYSGVSAKGYVRVDTIYNQWMSATFNVRYAPDVGHENSSVQATISLREYSDDVVNFQGYDAKYNAHFFCYIDYTDPKFDTAKAIASSVGDGTRLYVYKLNGSNKCLNVYMDNRSIYLH